MDIRYIKLFRCITYIVFILVMEPFITSCQKESIPDLQAPGNPTPFVSLTANIENDSVNYIGGVNGYSGKTYMSDSLNYRKFVFILDRNDERYKSCFKISIRNYRNSLGDPQADLDSSLKVGIRSFEFNSGSITPATVSVSWYDSLGTESVTNTIQQIHHFKIIESKDILFMDKKYKCLDVEFQCELRNINSNYTVQSCKGTILFSI